MSHKPSNVFRVAPGYQPLLRKAGLGAEEVFTHADIQVWRKLPDRENSLLDVHRPDGSTTRLHIKRYAPVQYGRNPADVEAEGIRALMVEQIPTVPLVGWGRLVDGRSFIITEDLAGFRAADKLIAEGLTFEQVLAPTARLAGRLHACGLHHRDLYLCHFFVRPGTAEPEVRLIDAARVRRLPQLFFRNRWIVKDLAQFWYSALQLNIPAELREHWLDTYAVERKFTGIDALRRRVEAKAAWIERHDAKLQAKQPNRNVSIPGA